MIQLSTSSGVPIFKQIVDQIVYMIEAGQLTDGDRLPSSRMLAANLHVNRNTVARAYAQLGDSDKAFDYMNQALDEHSPGLVLLNVDRAWDQIRADPRFKAAVRRVGLPS